MRMIGIVRVRPVLPNVGVPKSLCSQLFGQLSLIHAAILTKDHQANTLPPHGALLYHPLSTYPLLAQKRLRPSRGIWGIPRERAFRLQERRSLLDYPGPGPP